MTKRFYKATNWLIVATLALMMFVQPNKANASKAPNGCHDSAYGTYRGITTGSFWSEGNKFDYVAVDTVKNIDNMGNSVTTVSSTVQGATFPFLAGPCTDTSACAAQTNPDGTGTSACTITASTCGDTGQTYSTVFTTDGNNVYVITSGDPSLQAFYQPTTLVRDCSE